jgi:hypothetical protein
VKIMSMLTTARLCALGCGILFSTIQPSWGQDCQNNAQPSTPLQRFEIHTNGTVTDTQTGLMWKQCLEGQEGKGCYGKAEFFSWDLANEQALLANKIDYAGQNGWRLPTIQELSSLIEKNCANPAINLQVFPHMPSQGIWSNKQDEPHAWSVDFSHGHAMQSFKVGGKYVRLVRDAH